MKQRDRDALTHQEGDGHTHAEGADDALHHDKAGHADSVIESYEAEENGGQHAVDGVSFQVVRSCHCHLHVLGEQGGQGNTMEKGQPEHDCADGQGQQNSVS